MTFAQAVEAAANRLSEECIISRPSGPVFHVDHLGQIRMQNDCLYLGDILDFDDWEVTYT